MKRIFSGIQPSGIIHIGNYLGAIKQWVELQNNPPALGADSIFCIVDLHAITEPQNPKELSKNILSIAAIYLAAGIDPKKSVIFVQSSRPEHTELAWILNCNAHMGELERMTQFKDKSAKFTKTSIPVGLFDYPVLMAADILLYKTTEVPVGEDQKQHVELTRDIAERFNHKYGQTFVIPKPIIKQTSARIMGLDDPTKKMSKSASSPNNYIAMTDNADIIRNKIKKAVTDSGTEIKADIKKPAITNLLNIYSEVSGKATADLEKQYSGKTYAQFKADLAEAIIEFLKPIQKKYSQILKDENNLKQILKVGSEKVAPIAQKTLKEVKEKVGLSVL
ncbi:MAG: tryptophan--tRNA ligase [Candidatus Berkelbacteria bacterium]|nr:tryptophan--tRNA ligase [Candidatus Berkelbacteria bacterium]